MRKLFNIFAISTVAVSLSACFNLEEKSFNRIEKDNFYQNENSVKGAIASVYYTAEAPLANTSSI